MADLRTIKKEDTKRSLFEYYLSTDGATRAEAAKSLKISKPAVSENTAELIEQGFLEEVGRQTDVVGKPGQVVQVKYRDFLILVLDATNGAYENAIGFSVFDLDHNVLLSGKQHLPDYSDIRKYLLNIDEKIISAGILRSQIKITVCAGPGVYVNNFEVNSSNRESDMIPFCEDTLKLLDELYNCRLLVMNDVNLAAVAVKHYGSGVNAQNLAYLWLDMGVGGAIVLNGKIFEGISGAAGELGYIRLGGKSGRVVGETISVQAIEARMIKEISQSPYLLQCSENGNAVNLKLLASGVRAGDEYCVKFITEVYEILAELAYNLSVLLDLDMIVLDGLLYRLFPEMKDYLAAHLSDMPYTSTAICSSGLDIPIIEGGFYIGRSEIIKHIF